MRERKSDRRTNLSMLLLLAVDQLQSATVYSLHSKLGLSMGSTSPALARMEKEGLLTSVTGGDRGKTSFSLTPAGRQLLKDRWKETFRDPKKDVEEVLRVVTLAFALGDSSDRNSATGYLEAASRARVETAEREQQEAEELKELASTPFGLYDWMRSLCSGARMQSEATALSKIAREIRKEELRSRISTNPLTRVVQEAAEQEETK